LRAGLAELEHVVTGGAGAALNLYRIGGHHARRTRNRRDDVAAEPHLEDAAAADRRASFEGQRVGLTVLQEAELLRDADIARRGVQVDHETVGRRVHAEIAVADALQLNRPAAAAVVEDRPAAGRATGGAAALTPRIAVRREAVEEQA